MRGGHRKQVAGKWKMQGMANLTQKVWLVVVRHKALWKIHEYPESMARK
jgi:hypothetical protein